MIAALLKEIDIQRNYLQNEEVETIYFGGGTPSLLPPEDIALLLTTLKTTLAVSGNAEITLETNPDDIDARRLAAWKNAGINRLSIGIQSFFDADLRWMNRAHNASQAMTALQLAVLHFENITVDLIYGSPGLSDDNWRQNVELVLAQGIPHISCYALTVEPNTPLQKRIRAGQSANVNPDQQSEQFLLLMQWLENAGYEHYEISNFAKPGFRSRHNSAYWQGKHYLGIGPSAHSFNGATRQWNVSNNQQYMAGLKQNTLAFETETLTITQQFNEYIMTALRTMEGIDLSVVEVRFGQPALLRLQSESKKHILSGHLSPDSGQHLQLTREGRLLADGIASDFFVV